MTEEVKTDVQPEEAERIEIDDLLNPKEETDKEEKETPPESSTEKKTETEESPSQEGEEALAEDTPEEENLPFHKHPRWQELQDELKTTREELEKFKTAKDEKTETDVSLPKWGVKLYGDDAVSKEAYQDYLTEESQKVESIKSKIKAEEEERQKREQEETDKWNKWVDQEVETLKADGKKFDKNELLNIALKYRPIDEQGNVSLQKAYDIYELQKKKPSADEKKRIADISGGKQKSDEDKDLPSSVVRSQSWHSILRK
jgi:hypothetical protein